MSLTLAKDEQIVKSFEYSNMSFKGRGGKRLQLTSTLIVTNRRIVNELAAPAALMRDEIPITSATYLHTALRKGRRGLALVILCVLSLAAAIASMVLGIALGQFAFVLVCLTLFVSGLIVALIHRSIPKSSTVIVEIASDKMCTPVMSLSSTGTQGRGYKAKQNGIKGLRIIVNPDVAAEMVDCIGALILDVKAEVASAVAAARAAALSTAVTAATGASASAAMGASSVEDEPPASGNMPPFMLGDDDWNLL